MKVNLAGIYFASVYFAGIYLVIACCVHLINIVERINIIIVKFTAWQVNITLSEVAFAA